MKSELTAYITLICTSGVFNLCLCAYVFAKQHQYTHIARLFMIYTASITIYCFASAFGLMSSTLEEIKFWTTALYTGMAFSPPLGLLFIMQYLGYKITLRRCMALLILPFITLLMVAANDWHHLHYRVFEIDPLLGAPYVYQEIGRWYMIHGVYTFSCMFVAFLLVLSHWKETAKIYRPQLIAIAFGQLVPMVTAFIYLVGFTPPGIDPVPMILWLSSLLYFWSISSSRLFTVMPFAKDAIFNSINDGVIVLDESNRIIESNQACKRMFPPLDRLMYGQDFEKMWPKMADIAFPFRLEEADNTQEIELDASGPVKRTYQVRISSLQHVHKRKGLLIIFTDITELKSLQLQLEHQAYYDELTRIYNRRAFFQQSTRQFAEAIKTAAPFSVILLDIDHFKHVNDTYGHSVGDQVLVHAAAVCQSQLKKEELFARYGGEEFVLAVAGCTESEAAEVAERLRSCLQSHPLVTETKTIPVTLSLGVAQADKESEETLYQLLNRADKALYAAKQAGRNCVHVYTKL